MFRINTYHVRKFNANQTAIRFNFIVFHAWKSILASITTHACFPSMCINIHKNVSRARPVLKKWHFTTVKRKRALEKCRRCIKQKQIKGILRFKANIIHVFTGLDLSISEKLKLFLLFFFFALSKVIIYFTLRFNENSRMVVVT